MKSSIGYLPIRAEVIAAQNKQGYLLVILTKYQHIFNVAHGHCYGLLPTLNKIKLFCKGSMG